MPGPEEELGITALVELINILWPLAVSVSPLLLLFLFPRTPVAEEVFPKLKKLLDW